MLNQPDDSEMIDWAERNGLENLRAHLTVIDDVKRESVQTLTVLMASIAASLAYVVRTLDTDHFTAFAAGTAVMVLWLGLIATVLVCKCLLIGEAPAPTNRPANLYQPTHPLNEVRKAELSNIDARITEAIAICRGRTRWINRVRIAALASPLWFAATAALAYSYHFC